MKTLEELLYAPRPGETPEAHKARCEEQDAIVRGLMSTATGHQLAQMLCSARNPLESRFSRASDATEAAFIDGQADVVALLLRRGTNLLFSKPTS
jgi:hypothetical protein